MNHSCKNRQFKKVFTRDSDIKGITKKTQIKVII